MSAPGPAARAEAYKAALEAAREWLQDYEAMIGRTPAQHLHVILADALAEDDQGITDDPAVANENIGLDLTVEHFQAARAALAAAPEPPVSDGWRDIASAPRDGTTFLAAGAAGSIFFGHWGNGVVDSSDYDEDGNGYVYRPATHWQPLPPAPKNGRE